MKYTIAIGILITLIAGALYVYEDNSSKKDMDTVITPDQDEQFWVWENPYTFKSVSLPTDWKVVEGEGVQEALLALQHRTGKSLIYILNEEGIEVITLEEYVESLTTTSQEELGFEQFEVITDEFGNDIYQGSGAKYLGENLVGTYIRIWSSETNHFWRAVAMTNMEYKSLEFSARELIQLLEGSTLNPAN